MEQTVKPMVKQAVEQAVSIHVVPGLPDIKPGDDLVALLLAAMDKAQMTLDNGDILALLRDPWGLPIQLAKRGRPMV